ncbi:microcyclamide/patellamide family RiPP [Coleofasciculus sp.]|uniref:microcyclamide/patellamide family RiPP n=1 Tax=Coleofasciculus sp. TaxID=3100458 RepID=UPI0039FB42AF
MDKKNILPQQGKPVFRTTTGKLPSYLAELSEEALGDAGVGASASICACAYDGAEASATACACAYDGAEASATACACAYE